MTPTSAAAAEAAAATAPEPGPTAEATLSAATASAATASAATAGSSESKRSGPRPITFGRKGNIEIAFLWFFVVVPFVAVIAAVPWAWGWGLTWVDVAIFAAFYIVTGFGVTVGFHRYLTHGSFKAKRWLRIALTIAGTMSVEGAPIRWVADHRRHHQFSDVEGDPHSPWRFGESTKGLIKGMVWAHVGWLFERDNSNARRFAPDLIRDPDIRRIQKNFVPIMLFSLFGPALIGGLVTWSWWGALTAYFWASLVRIALVHHVTWAVNSVCHVVGEQPYRSNDKAHNFWPLAILSFGESWHNSHHADPTCARHGVDRGQIDTSARLIWLFEKAGWAWDVRWPKRERFEAKRMDLAA